ncbi:MAG: hypothetical protein ACJAX4_001782 [Clostridium sp.]|jgi:hypothetical protein
MKKLHSITYKIFIYTVMLAMSLVVASGLM